MPINYESMVNYLNYGVLAILYLGNLDFSKDSLNRYII